MAFDLQSWLLRFLQIYRLDPKSLEDLMIEAGDAQAEPGTTLFDEAAAADLRTRTLIESEELKAEVEGLVALFPPIPEATPETFESFQETFELLCQEPGFLDSMAEAIRKSFGANVALQPLCRDKDFRRLLFEGRQEQARRDIKTRAQSRVNPDRLALRFALEFASSLNHVVSREQELDDLDYGDILSDNMRLLFVEAHRCYLHGLTLSVAILCGSILEQALRETLREDWKLEQLLREAEDRGILTPEEWGMGDTVREMRNLAVHDLAKFQNPRINKASLLIDTRKVVKSLLATQSPR